MSQQRGQISADYASPALRWALLVEDYPGATHRFSWEPAEDIGVPAAFGGEQIPGVCVATIVFPQDSGREEVTAWKPPEGGAMNPDAWNTLCTKTLGRALKRAGYPDDVTDLKTVILWRRRRAELAALAASGDVPALGPGESVEKALEDAARPDPDDPGADDRPALAVVPSMATGSDDDAVADGEIVDDEPEAEAEPPARPAKAAAKKQAARPQTAASSEVTAQLREAINAAAKAGKQAELREWAQAHGIANFARPADDDEAARLIAHATELVGASE